MLKLVDITFYAHRDFTKPQQVLDKHVLSTRYAQFLRDKVQVIFVKHAGFKGAHDHDGFHYSFFKALNKFWYVPLASLKFAASQKPDVVLVQGLGFPLQTIAVRLFCGSRVKILVQHHGELPLTGFKLKCQQLAAKLVDGYLFTAAGNAAIWRQGGVIKPYHRVFEVLEASTNITPLDGQQSRAALNVDQNARVFLWVGRLNANKNPLGTLEAFEKYLRHKPRAQLYMIYSEDDQLEEVKTLTNSSELLSKAVHLIGKVSHQDMAKWYSAADYYLSGSFKEGSGYALLEAMACGCIPIITNIPSFFKITGEGKFGHMYTAGNAESLYQTLCNLDEDSQISLAAVIAYFKQQLSFEMIAQDIYRACVEITGKG